MKKVGIRWDKEGKEGNRGGKTDREKEEERERKKKGIFLLSDGQIPMVRE